MLRLALALVATSVSLSSLADLRLQSPDQICSILKDTQLRAGEWTSFQDGHEACASGARLATPTSTDGNKIAFFAEGASGKPQRVRLTLNVLLPSDEDAAKRELLRATKRLSVRALGLSIPHQLDEAIMRGLPLQLEIGSGRATLTRTGVSKQSYMLSVVME
ncbi:hypothetical protein D3C87_1154320 [compost metagenome]